MFKIFICSLVSTILLFSCVSEKNHEPKPKSEKIESMIICREGIKALTNHKKQRFVSIRPGDSINKNSYATSIKIHKDFDPVSVYKNKDSLIILNKLHKGEDLQLMKDTFNKLNKDILECLGPYWEGKLEDWDGDPRIRIHRYVIKHKYQKNLGEMITILRQDLKEDHYLISFSYK